MTSQRTNDNGVGFFGLFFLVLLVLKLTQTIDWSWWWITAPLWGPLALALSIVTFFDVGGEDGDL